MRSKKSTMVALAMVAAIGVATLSGCSGGNSSASGQTAKAGEPVTITFWSWLANVKPVVDEFNKTHSDVQVKLTEIPSGTAGGYAKESAALQAGNAPDVVHIEYPYLPDYAAQGYIKPISDVVSGDPLSPYSDGVKPLVKFGGKTWALPYDSSPMVYYYRTDLFQQAGITSAPKTWDEFATDAAKFKAKFPNDYITSFWPNEPMVFAGLSCQAGAQWYSTSGDSWKVNINDAATQKVASYWQNLISNKQVKVEQAYSDEWAADLKSGAVASVVGANWSANGIISRAPGQDGKWAVAELPNWGTPNTCMYGGSSFAISANSKHPKQAAEFIQWLTTSKDAMKARGDVGSAVMADAQLTDVAKSEWHATLFGDQDIYAVFDSASKSMTSDWSWGPGIPTAVSTFQDDLAKVTSGSTINQAVSDAQSKVVSSLKSEGVSVAGS